MDWDDCTHAIIIPGWFHESITRTNTSFSFLSKWKGDKRGYTCETAAKVRHTSWPHDRSLEHRRQRCDEVSWLLHRVGEPATIFANLLRCMNLRKEAERPHPSGRGFCIGPNTSSLFFIPKFYEVAASHCRWLIPYFKTEFQRV